MKSEKDGLALVEGSWVKESLEGEDVRMIRLVLRDRIADRKYLGRRPCGHMKEARTETRKEGKEKEIKNACRSNAVQRSSPVSTESDVKDELLRSELCGEVAVWVGGERSGWCAPLGDVEGGVGGGGLGYVGWYVCSLYGKYLVSWGVWNLIMDGRTPQYHMLSREKRD